VPAMGKEKGKVKHVTEGELKQKLSSSSKGDERRGGERIDAKLQVEVPLATWEQVRQVYTTNISKGGMLFTLTSPTTMPAAVDLTLTLPDGVTVVLSSEVRHVSRREGSTEFDVGVQFVDVDEKVKGAFEKALAGITKG
jgi:c-di-GMP-binding flagellar brake protein YcgR